jgi:hypothetical protein
MSEDPTQISLRTVLEAVNAIGVELHNFREEMQEFRATVEVKLDDLDEQISILAGDVTKVRARILRHKSLGKIGEAVDIGERHKAE